MIARMNLRCATEYGHSTNTRLSIGSRNTCILDDSVTFPHNSHWFDHWTSRARRGVIVK